MTGTILIYTENPDRETLAAMRRDAILANPDARRVHFRNPRQYKGEVEQCDAVFIDRSATWGTPSAYDKALVTLWPAQAPKSRSGRNAKASEAEG